MHVVIPISEAQLKGAKCWADEFRNRISDKDGSLKDRIIGRLGELSVKQWLKKENVRVKEGDLYAHDLYCYTPCGVKKLEVKTKWSTASPKDYYAADVRCDQLKRQGHDTNYYVFTNLHRDNTGTLLCTILGYELPNVIASWPVVKQGQLLHPNKIASRYDMHETTNDKLSPLNHLLAYLK